MLAIFRADPERYRDAIRVGRRFIKSGTPLTRTAAAAGYYLINRVNPTGPVDEFFEGLITGADVPKGDPRLALARNLASAKDRRKRRDGTEHLALLIKVWNQWATGAKNITTVGWKVTEMMPRVHRLGKALVEEEAA
jgi:hypothetical protein